MLLKTERLIPGRGQLFPDLLVPGLVSLSLFGRLQVVHVVDACSCSVHIKL